jgi:hypothetical protein
MADQNPEDIIDLGHAIEAALEAVRRGADIPADAMRTLEGAARRAARSQEELDQEAKQLRASFAAAGTSLAGMIGAVGKGNTSFNVLNSAITAVSGVVGELLSVVPLVGGALKGLTVAAGQATSYMIDQYQSAYGAFENLSQVGAAGAQGIEDIRTQFGELGLPIEAMAAIVAKNSQRLAGLSGTVLDASKQFTATAGAMKQLDDQGNSLDMQLRVLGYSSDEIADTMIQYADLQRRFSAQQTLSNEQLTAGTLAYGKELDAIAKLTGMSRKQLQSEMDQMMLNERFAAKIRDMQLNGQEAAAKELQAAVLAQTAMGNRQMASAIMAAATGFYTTPEAKAAAATIPGFADNVGQLASGSIKMAEFTQNLQDSAKIAEEQYRGLAMATGNNTVATQMYNEQLNLATRDAGKIGEAITGAYTAIDQGTTVQDETTKNLAGAKISLENASAAISMLATDFPVVADGVKTLAVAIDETVQWIRKTLNESPNYAAQETQARETLAQIADTEKQLRDHLAGINPISEDKVTELNNHLAELNKKLANQKDTYWDGWTSSRPITPETRDLYMQMDATQRRLDKELYEQPAILGDNSIGKQIRDAFVDEEQLAQEKEQKRKPYEPKDVVAPTEPSTMDKIGDWLYESLGGDLESLKNKVAEPVKIGPKQQTPSTTIPTTPSISPTTTAPESLSNPETNLQQSSVSSGPKSGYQPALTAVNNAITGDELKKQTVEIKDSRDMKPQLELLEKQTGMLAALLDEFKKNTNVNEKMFRSNYS